MIKKLLIKLLAALGVTMPPETADDAITPFVVAGIAKIEGMKPKIKAGQKIAAANSAKISLKQQLTTAKAELKTTQDKIAALEAEKLTLANAKRASEAALKNWKKS